jgi:catechol 2,3-dioxygenase-like lactoylglutathione lyase family enzyme
MCNIGGHIGRIAAMTAADIAFTGAEPCLFVRDFARARDFYVGKLGFTLAFAYGEPPFYGLVSRGMARLTLRLVRTPVFRDGVRESEDLLAASLTLGSAAEIETLHDGWLMAGAPIHQPLRTEPWGARTFIIRDPDGNLVLVASPAT